MPRLLFVTPRITEPPQGGRDMLSHLHLACLRELLGGDLAVHELDRQALAGVAARIGALQGYVDGLSRDSVAAAVARVRAENVEQVFLNGSNLGRLAATLKSRLPHVQVLTFCHNVESRFFYGSFRQHKSLRSLAVLLANYRAERLAVRCSDRLVALSRRDSSLLQHLHGRAATDLLPMALADQRSGETHPGEPLPTQDYLLFVGGGFYANKQGIEWFAQSVAPRIKVTTCVVGRGLESSRERVAGRSNVVFVGAVDRLEPWYRGARAVIAPIFDGSGMKTKVAEALMFGKPVIGTDEAFSGYEDVASEAGSVCNSEDEFVLAIENAFQRPAVAFDETLRALYETHHSREATVSRLAAILNTSHSGVCGC